MKKVLMLLTNPFRPDPRVYEEAKTLVNNGYRVTILAWDRGEGYPSIESRDGIEIVRFNVPASYGRPGDFIAGISRFYLGVLNWMGGRRFDYIHANDFDTLPLGVIIKKLHGGKLVYDAHDHYASMIADVLPSFVVRTVRKIEKWLLRYTDVRIAASEHLGRMLFPPLSYVTVFNAKRLEDYDISREEVDRFRKKINPDSRFLIVYIGILKLWTPLPQIIEAVKKIGDAYLLIGGKGPHEREITEMIENAENIKYMGWIEKEKIPLYTLASSVIILPSNPCKDYTRVGAPNKIMEGLAAGKPIIAGTDTAGGEIVKECNAGYLCSFGDIDCLVEKIRYLIDNPEERERLGKNARYCAEKKYNWRVMEKRLLSAYQKA